jgi:hypothetical protein
MASLALRPLSIGEVIDASFQVYRRHFSALATIVLVCNGLPALLQIYGRTGPGIHLMLTLVYMVLVVVLSLVATGATVFVVSESYLGRSITAREALTRALPFVVPLIIVSLLVGLVAFVGFLLIVVPGLIAVCGLAVTVPALVVESLAPTDAMGRSWALTRGYRLRMFGLFVLIFLLILIPYIAIMGAAGVAAAVFGATGAKGVSTTIILLGTVLAAIVQLLLSPLYQAALVIAYYDLRVRKEGFDLEVLASVLQPA